MTLVVEVPTDECDACGDAHTKAYVYAEHPNWAASLAYCGSHGTRYMNELRACGATIIDLRHLIGAT